MCMTFMRLQEFYESPFKNIKGQFFTLEEYMDAHQKRFGTFDYCDKWLGFNVPGDVVLKFYETYMFNLRPREIKLYQEILKKVKFPGIFYIIGVCDDETIDHEVAHGFFYLNEEYRKEVIALVNALPKDFKQRFTKALKAKGYCDEVIIDEIHAYSIDTATDKRIFPDNFKITPAERKLFKPFLNLFRKYKRNT